MSSGSSGAEGLLGLLGRGSAGSASAPCENYAGLLQINRNTMPPTSTAILTKLRAVDTVPCCTCCACASPPSHVSQGVDSQQTASFARTPPAAIAPDSSSCRRSSTWLGQRRIEGILSHGHLTENYRSGARTLLGAAGLTTRSKDATKWFM